MPFMLLAALLFDDGANANRNNGHDPNNNNCRIHFFNPLCLKIM